MVVFWGELCIVTHTVCFESPVIPHRLQKDQVRDGEEEGENPHCHAADLNHPGLPAGVHLGSMDDRQVAVQTDAGQKKDPTVEVNLMGKKKKKQCQHFLNDSRI